MSQGDNNKINNLAHAEKQIPYIVKTDQGVGLFSSALF